MTRTTDHEPRTQCNVTKVLYEEMMQCDE